MIVDAICHVAIQFNQSFECDSETLAYPGIVVPPDLALITGLPRDADCPTISSRFVAVLERWASRR